MPQLMPLNWMMSGFMLFYVMISMGFIYSCSNSWSYLNKTTYFQMSKDSLWCW